MSPPRWLAIAVVTAFLSGCGGLPIAFATGGVLGYLKAANEAAPYVLTAVRPITTMWCADRLKEGHSPAGLAALKAFCSNLPTSTATLAAQAVAVVAALATVDGPM